MTSRHARHLIVLGLLGAATPTATPAQETIDRVVLHGFGSWVFGKTTRNNVYLAGRPEGDFRHVALAVKITANIDDRITAHGQAEIRDNEDGSRTTLNYGFAEYRFSDRIAFRIGQVKHPFGLYTEVFTVGTLRPFLHLPQGFYGPVGFAGQAYRGIGLTGAVDAGAWTIDYDVYGGGIDLELYPVPELFYRGEPLEDKTSEVEIESSRNVVGGRLVLHTPIRGLRVGSSGYTGVHNEEVASRTTVVAAQLDYSSNQFTLESEIGYRRHGEEEEAVGGYVQLAYRLTPEWQVAAQYDRIKDTFFGVETDEAPSLQHHKEGAIAVSYWLSRALVLKTEYHRVSGNRFALPEPEQFAIDVAGGRLRTTTHLVQFGGQFSF